MDNKKDNGYYSSKTVDDIDTIKNHLNDELYEE